MDTANYTEVRCSFDVLIFLLLQYIFRRYLSLKEMSDNAIWQVIIS